MDDKIKKTIKQYDKIAEEYSKNISVRASIEDLDKFIGYLKTGKKLIDIGCAAGRDTNLLTIKGYDTTGVDLSENLLAIARRNNPDLKFIKADIRSLPFPDSSVDGIWARAVFHHLEKKDMMPALNEFNRVLKNDGVIFLRTKMGEGDWKGEDPLSVGEEREFVLLTKNELEEMFLKSNFEKINLEVQKDKTRDLYWLTAFCRKK